MEQSVDGGSVAGSHASNGGTASLTLRHVFGFKCGVRSNLHFLHENTVLYPAGHNVVLYRIEQREQSFIYASSHPYVSEGITSLAVSSNHKLVAVGEKTAERAVVTLYEAATMKKKKVISYTEPGSREIVSICFSSDCKNLLTQGGGPDWSLILWNIEKAVKVVCSIKLYGPPVTKADLCPSDPNVVCLSGEGILRFFRIQEGSFRPIPLILKREAQVYTCHCWLSDDKVVVSTDTGDLFLIDSFELKGVIHHAKSAEEQASINCIAAFAKGFICGGANGIMRIFERFDDSRELYKCTKIFHLAPVTTTAKSATMINLALSPSEETLLCCTNDQQIYTFSLSNMDILKEDSVCFENLGAGFHGPNEDGRSHITGIDVCVWKPVAITTGVDKSVRVWNYRDKALELVKYFPREAFSVSLHPSGLYCLLGFPEALKLASIFVNDIRPFLELNIKNCNECHFSIGGEFFAAVSNSVVQVYSTYSGELLSTLKGHSGKVRSLGWKKGDRKMVTASVDGTIVVWNVLKGIKENEFSSSTRIPWQSCACSSDLTSAFATGLDSVLRHIDLASMTVKGEIALDTPVASMALTPNSKMLFVGTAEEHQPGRLRTKLLGGSISYQEPFVDVYCHDGAVSKVCLTFDGQLLLSGGQDGALCLFEVVLEQPEEKRLGMGAAGSKVKDHKETGDTFGEEILVTKADLEEQGKVMAKLRNKVEELSLNNEYQLRVKDLNYKDKLKDITDNFQEELHQAIQKYDMLMDEKKSMEMEFEDTLRQLDGKHESEFKSLEEQYTHKMNAEILRYQELFMEKEAMNRKWDEENQVLIEAHAEYLQQITEEYDTKVCEEQKKQKELEDLRAEINKEFQHLQRLIEEDADMEVDQVQEGYEARLKQEREATLRLKFENGIKKRTFTSLTKDVEDQAEEVKALKEKQKDYFDTIRVLEKDIQGHKKEIREREETIVDKDRRIFDLKKRNQELEKFKFVLDYKIKELRRQIEPREKEIKSMRTQIEEMGVELEQYHKSNAALQLMIGELKLKMEGLQRESEEQDTDLARCEEYLMEFRQDIKDTMQLVDDHKELKTRVITLFKNYVQKESSTGSVVSGPKAEKKEFQEEYNRQREHLEKNVEALKSKIFKDMALFESDHQQLVRDNVLLTEEINYLRREEKRLEVQRLQLMRAADSCLGPKARMMFHAASSNNANAGKFRGNRSTRRGSLHESMPPSNASSNRTSEAAVTTAARELEMQRQQIEQLEGQIRVLQDALDIPPAERIKQLG